ncbi:MAG: hypothetical protein EOP49_01285 [Sphingobacteriales bacterium]|nr:MAG: hypothetical protein EOP49_01285 [Sphingobacteriales bacterium]
MEMQSTYELKRSCLYCGAKIADNEHGTRKFCYRTENEDGSIRDCKSDFHAEQRAAEMQPYLKLAYALRDTDKALKSLITEKGERVSLEELNRAGVDIMSFSRLRPNKYGHYDFHFVAFRLEQVLPDSFKIVQHEIH